MTILDTGDQVDLLTQIARKKYAALDMSDEAIRDNTSKPKMKKIAWACNDWREKLQGRDDLLKMASGDGPIHEDEVDLIEDYIKLIRERNQTDFSGLLSETVRLLRTDEDARKKLQSRFQWMQIDEYQDTNGAQIEIVELLAGPADNVVAVGDADQSIYAFRGANPEAINTFINNGRAKNGCEVFKLGVNYRCTPEIVKAADTLIRNNQTRHALRFEAHNPSGDKIIVKMFDNPTQEAEAIAANIMALHREGNPFKEIAIFYRTNQMSREIEQALRNKSIPYIISGGGSFYDRMEIKDTIAILRFLASPKDGIALSRFANKPVRKFGPSLLGKVESFAEANDIDLLQSLERSNEFLSGAQLKSAAEVYRVLAFPRGDLSVSQIAATAIARLKYDEWIKKEYEKKGGKREVDERIRNVNELINSIALFCNDNPDADISDYLQSITLYTEGDDAEENDDAVRLMTLHASKGLEFETVFMIGCEKDILPHKMCIDENPESGWDEERRLCYVGMTRAKKRLRMLHCKCRPDTFNRKKGEPVIKYNPPSFYLVQAGLMDQEEYERIVKAQKNTDE
jgi:DNA helicase-2/ATP-dependent DNA helicase PcrA